MVRAGKTMLITGARPQVLGGIQPGIFGAVYGYALRLAGGLHAIRQFAHGLEPCTSIGPEELQHGLDAVGFYLGQAVDALQVILDDTHAAPQESSGRTVRLAQVLAALRGEVESGRLAVGHVWERFNAGLTPEEQFATSNSFGAFLRSCGLTLTAGKHNANGRRGVHCLVWDEQVENRVMTSPPCPPSPLSQAGSSVMAADRGETISAGSSERGDMLVLEADQADFVPAGSAAENPLEFDKSGVGGQGGLLMTHHHPEPQDGAFA